MPAWLGHTLGAVSDVWRSLGDDGQFYAWLATGVAGIAVWTWAAHAILRRLAGHRKFRGRWYGESEYARLMQVLWEDQQAGTRVMSREELNALRDYRYGDSLKPILTGKGGGYFDV
jgi:hypothetical protein